MNMPRSSFRLEDTVARSFAVHDGTTLDVPRGSAEQNAFLRHEEVHERIFTDTADGALHFYAILLSSERMDMPEGYLAERLTAFLFDDTRQAHERAATYIGIMNLMSEEDRRRAFDSLDNEYLQHFAFFDRLIGSGSTSTYVQTAIALGITFWAFSTSRTQHVTTPLDVSALDAISLMVGPTWRLDLLEDMMRNVTASTIVECIVEVAKAQAPEIFACWADLHDEAEWSDMSAGFVKQQVTDRALVQAAAEWSAKVTSMPLCSDRVVHRQLKFVVSDDVFRPLNLSNLKLGDVTPEQTNYLVSAADKIVFTNRDVSQLPILDLGDIAAAIANPDLPRLFFSLIHTSTDLVFRYVLVVHGGTDEAAARLGSYKVHHEALDAVFALAHVAREKLAPMSIAFDLQGENADYEHVVSFDCDWLHAATLEPLESLTPSREGQRTRAVLLNYVSKNWSKVLNLVPGRICEVNLQWRSEDGHDLETYFASVVFPDGEGRLPLIKLVTSDIAAKYAPLVHRKVSEGTLIPLEVTAIRAEYRALFDALWWAAPSL
jgi:hypothetical protein